MFGMQHLQGLHPKDMLLLLLLLLLLQTTQL
jgi:hypothetical protein